MATEVFSKVFRMLCRQRFSQQPDATGRSTAPLGYFKTGGGEINQIWRNRKMRAVDIKRTQILAEVAQNRVGLEKKKDDKAGDMGGMTTP